MSTQRHMHAGRGPDDGAVSRDLDTVPAGHAGTVYTCPMHPSLALLGRVPV